MSLKYMIKFLVTYHIAFVFFAFLNFVLGPTAWIIVGSIIVLSSAYLTYWEGKRLGERSYGLKMSVDKIDGKVDEKTLKDAYDPKNPMRAFIYVAGSLIGLNVLYFIVYLINNATGHQGFINGLNIALRVVTWVLSLPFFPLISHWNETLEVLSPLLVIFFLVYPTIWPGCLWFGYSRGPKLWQKTESAMAKGRRRAKAKARIYKNDPRYRSQAPKI